MAYCHILISMLTFLIVIYASDQYCGPLQVFNVTHCDYESQRDNQCLSLDEITNETEEHANVEINIQTSELQLNTSVNFVSLTSLMVNGMSNFTTINCMAGAGIVLQNISDTVAMYNLKLLSCGSQAITKRNGETEIQIHVSALTIIHCSNVKLDQLYITNSRGIGLTVLDHQGGIICISSSIFEHSGVQEEYDDYAQAVSGGGIYIKMSYSTTPTLFHFDNCTFKNNTAYTTYRRYVHADAIGLIHEGNGEGGGVNLILGPGLSNVSVCFKNCYFVANQAFHGGGLKVNILGDAEGKTKSINVNISDSTFHRNGKHGITFGGGAYMQIFDNSSDHTYYCSIVDCHYFLKNVTFMDNSAENGGGVHFFSSKQTFPNSNTLVLRNCTFKRNVAHIGSATLLSSLSSFSGNLMIPMLKNCQFEDNKVNNSQIQPVQSSYGKGTIYINKCVVRFSGFNVFNNNEGSGIHVVSGVVDFQDSNITFMNNTSLRGGALVLIGSSTMIIGPNKYDFIKNSATYQGGAIYVRSSDRLYFTTSRGCFLKHSDSWINTSLSKQRSIFTFIENKAVYGPAIFATSFHSCQIINYEFINISQIFSKRGVDVTFNTSTLPQPQLATEVAMLSTSSKNNLLKMIPRKRYYGQLIMTDDLNNSVNTSFRVAIETKTGEVQLDSENTYYVGGGIQLRGKPGARATLFLETIESSRDVYIRLEVELTECPPGYTLDDNLRCVCDADAYIGLFKCQDFKSYLLPGYWAGIINATNGPKFVTSACRFYAEYDNNPSQNVLFEIALPENFSESEISKIICGDTRTGVGCGKCRGSHSVYFHSPNFKCGPRKPYDCNLGWLFYFLSELLPITLIFISVLLLNISFTSGTVNGFILFSQLLLSMDIDASGIIVYPQYAKQRIQYATDLYKLIYGFLNLDVFNSEYFSFCLMKSATALDTLAFKYITILYTILLVVSVILIMNKCKWQCLGKHHRITDIKISIIHGISTFLVLCYSQCIEVSIGLLIPLHIHMPANDSNFTCSTCTRVWFNGELVYFHRDHLLYALPALFCLLTIGLLPPVLLLTYPLLNKLLSILGLENNKVVNSLSERVPICKLKPLFDSFQSCFKDNLRFFAGLYFLYRWTLLLVYFVKDFSQYYITVGTILLLILVLHTVFQPYTKNHHNLIDALLFANLLLINSLSSFNFQKINSRKAQYGATVAPAIVQLVLIYSPLVIVLTYFLCKCTKKIQNLNPKMKQVMNNIIVPLRVLKLREISGMQSEETDSNINEDELIHDRLGIEYSEYNVY